MCPEVPSQCNQAASLPPEIVLQDSIRLFGPSIVFVVLGLAIAGAVLIALLTRGLHDDN